MLGAFVWALPDILSIDPAIDILFVISRLAQA